MKSQSQQNYFPSQHPLYDTLDYYERAARRLLKSQGQPTDLDSLMRLKLTSKDKKGRQHLRSILWSAERVRECIKKQDAEGSARFMFRFTVAVKDADLSLQGAGRKGHRKNRQWLDMAISEAMRARKTGNCKKLWRYFKVKHHFGEKENILKLGPPAYGSVYFQNDNLIFDDNDTLDPITYHTFQKKLTEIKKNLS